MLKRSASDCDNLDLPEGDEVKSTHTNTFKVIYQSIELTLSSDFRM